MTDDFLQSRPLRRARSPTLHCSANDSPQQATCTTASNAKLIRKALVLKKLGMSKSMFHARLSKRSRYFDPTLPRPIYMPNGRTPYWVESDIDDWINGLQPDDGSLFDAELQSFKSADGVTVEIPETLEQIGDRADEHRAMIIRSV